MRTVHELYRGIARSIGMYAAAGAIGCGAAEAPRPQTPETPQAVEQEPVQQRILSVDYLVHPFTVPRDHERTGGFIISEFDEIFVIDHFKSPEMRFSLISMEDSDMTALATEDRSGRNLYLDRDGDGRFEFRFPKDYSSILYMMHVLQAHDDAERDEERQEDHRRWHGTLEPYAALQR